MKLTARLLQGGLLAAFAAAAAPAHATVSFALKGGLNYTKSSLTLSGSTARLSRGFMGGVGVLAEATGFFGLMCDLLYTQRNTQYKNDLTGLTTDFEAKYLHLPLQVVVHMGPILITAGAYYATMIGDPSMVIDGVSTSFKADSSSDYGFTGGLGGKLSHFALEARYNHGLKAQSNSSDSKLRSIDVLAGFYF